jgi:predicted AAA+ superfamily ATPase
MNEEILSLFNPWWAEEYEPPGIIRDRYLDRIDHTLSSHKIVILYGLRRVGKTTIMRQFASRSIGRLEPSRIMFISMDHPEIKEASLHDLIITFRRISKIQIKEPHLILIDEIQHREGFEDELKAEFDMESGLEIVVSGSSSMIVKQRSSALTGRHRDIHVRPLDLIEYLAFKGKKWDPHQPHLMESHMEDYLKVGGLPERVITGEPDSVLELVDDVIEKDIALTYDVKDPVLLRDLYFLLLNRIGKPMTFSKIGRIMNISHDSTRRYVGYLERSFLIDVVERYGSPNARKYSPRKCYCPDNGIRTVIGGRIDLGSLAENQVYLELKKSNNVNYYSDGGKEIDFICGDVAVESKYKDTISEVDIDTLLTLNRKKIKRKVTITRSHGGQVSGVRTVPLWRLVTEGL